MNHGDRAAQIIEEEAWEEHWGETSEALMVALVHSVLDLAEAVRGLTSSNAHDIGMHYGNHSQVNEAPIWHARKEPAA